jgi:hypothetical protein
MIRETLLFWTLLLAFLFIDNIITLANGKDALSFDRKGKPYYKFRQRNKFGNRNIILLNPLNLFDRIVSANELTLRDEKYQYKRDLRSIKFLAINTNSFVYLGYFYLFYLIINCYLSFALSFEAVVLNILIGHIVAWLCSAFVFALLYKQLSLPLGSVSILLAEALFVPAYLINLGKKISLLKSIEFCTLRFYMRKIKTTPEVSLELVRYELLSQVNSALDGEVDQARIILFEDYSKCLRT